ncbi:MAG: thiamine pyrophosphate-binding protein [Spirochaetes bacterium]|nr:thiamine pyrophosphate-binding protein [Spirochaetota bacterium]
MNMKVSDYIVSFFASHHIEYIFGYQGGMITHLVDSISKNKNVQFIQCYHEQTSAIAAEGYARASGKFGVAISTSGPGATNMVTGIANAYFDSVPVIYITGQVNTNEYKYNKKIRQLGFQETNIVSIVKPVTKYAVMIDDPNNIKYELAKAVHIATTGRKGPVLLDIPMNIQRSEIQISNIPSYDCSCVKPNLDISAAKQAFTLLQNAKRPLVLCGGGILASKTTDKVNDFLVTTNLPYVVSLMGKGSVDETKNNFVGMIGSYGNRCANIIFSNADVILVLGSRLDLRQTGNRNIDAFRRMFFIHVDIDTEELQEDSIKNKLALNADIGDFIEVWESNKTTFLFGDNDWLSFSSAIKKKYSQKKDIERFLNENEPYLALEKIMSTADDNTIFTVDIGQNQMWSAQVLQLKSEQLFFTGGGLAPMGYALHAAIGASFASPEKQIVCIMGDGGFHMALQALLLISQYKLRISIFVLNNYSLGMITQFQTLYFDSNMAGTVKEGGYEVPDIEYIAKACRLDYVRIDDVVSQKLPDNSVGKIVEISLKKLTTVVPKLEFDQPLYNMLPYLNDDEIKKITELSKYNK